VPDSIGWDTTDPDNPQPVIYPVCSDCGDAYDYRRYLSLGDGKFHWAWFKPAKVPKGCRHKGEARTHDARELSP
jgi:hypothetical protein